MYDNVAQTKIDPARTNMTTSAIAGLDESQSVIRDFVSYTEQTLSELHEAINVIEKRLETALSPVPPAAADTARSLPGKTGDRPVSHLAGRLMILNDGSQQAVARLRELARRVEL